LVLDKHINMTGISRLLGSVIVYKINVREYRRGNLKWTIQRNWQHSVHKTQYKDKQNKSTTQYVFDTTMSKQTQIT
jgi:hypothetical protein